MKDQEARDQIIRLTERIRVLERDSRVGLNKCEKLLLSQGCSRAYSYGTPIDVAVELILEHLGLELELVPYVSGHHILRKKDKLEASKDKK